MNLRWKPVTIAKRLTAAEKNKGERKKLEFMQRVALYTLIFSTAIVAAVHAGNFVLLWHGKESMSQEVVATVTTYGSVTTSVATMCYAALTGARNISANHTGLTKPEDLGGDDGNG